MAKFFKILLTAVIVLLLVAVVGGYIFINTFDFNKYKGYVTELASKELGRKLAINGDASVGISLVPTIVLEDVELANASWASAPQMVKVEKLEVRFSLLPLLKKQIEIDNINLVKPQIYLETAKNGEQNWVFKVPAENEKERAAAVAEVMSKHPQESKEINSAGVVLAGLVAKSVTIEDGLVVYDDKGSKTEVKINSVALSLPGMDEKINLSFDVLLNSQQIKGSAIAGSLNNFLNSPASYPLNLAVKAYGVDVSLDGVLSNMLNNLSYNFKTNVYNPAGNFGAPETTLIAQVSGDLKKVLADISSLNVVNNLVTGKVSADVASGVPYINADLKSSKFDLTVFNQNSNMAWNMPELVASVQASALVPDIRIPFAVLKQVNADVKLSIGTLIIDKGMQADNVKMAASLKNGMLNVNPLQLGFGGGEADASLQANAAAQSMVLKLTGKNLQLQKIHQEFQISGANDFGISSGGNLDLDINLKGSGATLRQLVNNLSGQAIVIVNKSVIQTGKLNFLTGNFVSQLLDVLGIKRNASKKIDLNCAVVRSDIGSGKAVFPKGIAVSAKQMTVVSDGSINLANDKIDFSIKPNITDVNVVQAIASFIKVKGTLENPKIAIDDKTAAKAIIGVAATGGTAYLGSQLLEVDSSPCYTALKGTAYQDRFPAPSGVAATTRNVYQDAEKQIGSGIKDLKNTAKDIIGIFKK